MKTRAQSVRAPVTPLGIDVPELQQARVLWQLNRFDDSLALFDKAVQKYPQNMLALVDASRAFGARFEIRRAEDLLDRLMELGGRNANVLHLAGQSYRMLFRPEKAIDCFQRAVTLSPSIADAHLELAVLYERRHRLDDALGSIEKCLAAREGYPEATFMQARLLRRKGDQATADNILRALASREENHPMVRAQAYAEIAQNFDRQGEYGQAIGSMLSCKALLRPHAAPLREESDAIIRLLSGIIASVSPPHFGRWAEQAAGFPQRRVALLASFPRSGTTLLEQVLDAHPDLVSSDEREAFARDIFPAMWMTPTTRTPTLDALDQIPPERLLRQRDRYLDYMAAALAQPIGERMHLDKNPPFTLLIPAILRLFPEMRLLIALRDPRDVVLSCFMQYLPMNTNSVWYLSIEETAERYAIDMGAWRRLREVIPPRWLEVRYEDLITDVPTQARRALEFLDLPWSPAVLEYRERLKGKPVNSPTYEAVSKPIYTSSVGRWKHYERYFGAVLDRLAPLVEAFGYS